MSQMKLKFTGDVKTWPTRLLAHGQKWHIGWDIPTKWAVDDEGQCWMDNGHGWPLHKVEKKTLLQELGDDYDACVAVHNAFGEKAPDPEWMVLARAHGWRPPKKKKSK